MSEVDHETPGTSTELRFVSASDDDLIKQAIALGDRNRRTLGLLPPAAYQDAAERGTLLAAVHSGRVVGYALYRLSRGRVALTHLCVSAELRRRGLAKMMVKAVSAKHADHRGVVAKCRRDYKLDDMWLRLGFRPFGEVRGRSRAGHPLVIWWLDHGHADLFSQLEPAVLRAAIDLNILRDFIDEGRSQAVESRALRADHIVDQLELAAVPALDREITQIEDERTRQRCRQAASELAAPPVDRQEAHKIVDDLIAAIHTSRPAYPSTDQDRLDVRYVAEAVAAGLTVLVTRDLDLSRTIGQIALSRHGLRIMNPVDVILHIDELTQAQVYRPAAIAGSEYRTERLGAGREDDLLLLANTSAGESPKQLQRRLRALAIERHPREAVVDPDGRIVAFHVAVVTDHKVDVPIFRVIGHKSDDTISRLVLFHLRKLCRDNHKSILWLSDPYLPSVVQSAAVAEGFRQANNHWYSYVIDECADADTVWQAASAAARRVGLSEPAPIRSAMPAVAAADVERAWWPAKLLDSQLESFVIPIRPGWAAGLFGVPSTLTARESDLALSRDHVYYRSPKPSVLEAPGRILWYLSGHDQAPHPRGIIACSQLDAVHTDVPSALHERFRHLGVWGLSEIEGAAHDGVAQAVRFSNTDIFPHPVPLRRLRQLGEIHGVEVVLPSPRRITAELFNTIYSEGGGSS